MEADGVDPNPQNLSALFNSAWKQFKAIDESADPAVSQPYQDSVKDCTAKLERCTRMVSMLGIFSRNEDIEEVSTGNLKFFLLPAFLGDLALKSTDVDRKTCVKNAKVYFTDFLKRCHCYAMTKKDLSKYINSSEAGSNDRIAPRTQTRDEKIAILKENKNFSSKIETMQKRLSEQLDTIEDDTIREYHFDWLHLWINKCMEHISFADRELEMLTMMEGRGGRPPSPPKPREERPPLKPILITREMIQKQVFGAGYKNLPTMTEEEYFEKEVREGKIVLDYDSAKKTDDEKNAKKESEDEDETEHDEEKLKKARDWDEYKDTHRRGDGNREGHG